MLDLMKLLKQKNADEPLAVRQGQADAELTRFLARMEKEYKVILLVEVAGSMVGDFLLKLRFVGKPLETGDGDRQN